MGVCTAIDIEEIEYKEQPKSVTDEKGITMIIVDIISSKDSIIHTLADKYNIDLTPFKSWPTDDEIIGPWQDPVKLWQAAYSLYQAFLKEGNNLIGEKLFFGKMTDSDLEFAKESLKDIIRGCKFAKENAKRVRFFLY